MPGAMLLVVPDGTACLAIVANWYTPKPPVYPIVPPAGTVAALFLVGLFTTSTPEVLRLTGAVKIGLPSSVRLKIFENSARICKFIRSLILKFRPIFKLSDGRRAERKSV